MRKTKLTVLLVAAFMLTACGNGNSKAVTSSSESSASSNVVQSVVASGVEEGDFESLKAEAESLLEAGNYKEAVTAAAKAYQLTDEKDGEEEIPLRVAEKLAEECGLQNPKAEIDTSMDGHSVYYIQIRCENLEVGRTNDEIIAICKKLNDEGLKIIGQGGTAGGAKKPYTIFGLLSEGKSYFALSDSDGKDELVTMEEEPASKTTQSTESASNNTKNNQTVSQEYKNALTKGLQYANQLYMSKQAVYDQLTSAYGEGFSADAAQYAVDNMTGVDWNANALEKAKQYYYDMAMSKSAVYDQLTSSYGEQFTASQAQYAIDHLD